MNFEEAKAFSTLPSTELILKGIAYCTPRVSKSAISRETGSELTCPALMTASFENESLSLSKTLYSVSFDLL